MTDARSPLVVRRHAIRMVVPDSDIDELGHASNIAYLRWVQDVTTAHSAAVGQDVASYRQLGIVWVVRRHEVDYLRPVLGGERLELHTWVRSAMVAKILRMTEIMTDDGEIAARALTTWACLDVSRGQPTLIPESVLSAFGVARDPALGT